MITGYEFLEKLYSEKKDVHSRFREAEEKGLAKTVEYKVTKNGKRYVTYSPGDVNLTDMMEKTYSTGDKTLDELLERAFCEGYKYAQREYAWRPNIKGATVGLGLGLASLFGGTSKASAQNNSLPEVKRDTIGVSIDGKVFNKRTYEGDWNDLLKYANKRASEKPLSTKQLQKTYPNAYRDRNKTPEHWKANQNSYASDLNAAGKVAASRGANPWSALNVQNNNRGNVKFSVN